MKLFLIGLWLTLVALGSTFAAASYLARPDPKTASPAVALEHQKTRVLNVPMIADGAVQGFVSVRFDFTIDGTTLKSLPVPPEVYVLDEAFRAIYADSAIDFKHLERYDIPRLTERIVKATNEHLGAPLIKEVLVSDMNYSPKEAPSQE